MWGEKLLLEHISRSPQTKNQSKSRSVGPKKMPSNHSDFLLECCQVNHPTSVSVVIIPSMDRKIRLVRTVNGRAEPARSRHAAHSSGNARDLRI